MGVVCELFMLALSTTLVGIGGVWIEILSRNLSSGTEETCQNSSSR
jgi:hypothetical protein